MEAQIFDSIGSAADLGITTNQQVLEIRTSDPAYQKGFYDLGEYMYVLPDTSGTFSIEQVSAEDWAVRFKADMINEVSLSQPAVDYYWVRLITRSNLVQDEKWLIHLALPEVVLFEAAQDSSFSRKLTGTSVPFSRRFFNDKYGHFTFLPLRLEAGQTQVWFFKVKAGEVLGVPYWKPTDKGLLTPQFISRFEANNRLSSALIFGIYLAVALYHFILFAYNRRKSFLYFALFVFFQFNVSFWFDSFFFEYFFFEAPGFNDTYLFYFIVLGHVSFLILFSRVYLQLNRYVPRGDRWLMVLFVFQLLYCLIVLSLVSFQPDLFQRYSTTFFKLFALSVFVVFLFILVLSLICMRRSVPQSGIFVLAIGINLLQQNINLLHSSAALPVPDYLVGDYGIALGLIVFAIGLGKQFKEAQEEKILAEALRQQQKEEADRLRELDKFKSRFYANITHEFRTPLTVIQGLADQIRENPRWKVAEYTTLIKRNSQKLLELINQMLDLSRLEAGKMEPKYIQDDIIKYLSYLIESFHSLGLDRHISVTFHAETERLVMDYDPEKIQRIIDNLVSNALKFTPEYGKVSVVASAVTEPAQKQWLEVIVRDTGIGIPKEKLPFIFDRFYRAGHSSVRKGEGAGLGLAMVRELLELMGGSIRVDSATKRGTTFTFRLPVHHEAAIVSTAPVDQPFATDRLGLATYPASGKDPTRTPLIDDEPSTVLLVEDNPDVITYLRSCLEEHYQLLEARNGRDGIDQALETIPDLVISDVMMPEMNGFELCNILKTDERTNHIPIVLLTAKATQTDRIEGLSQGADAYLAKPFQKEELLVRLEQLLELRRQLQQKYQSGSPEVEETEDPFLQKVKALINRHLDDPDLRVQQLSREVGLSRVQLHRKLKALTDRSTTQLIREIRLQKAYDLLQHSDLHIAEIAYRVGFNDPGHFSRSFSKYYNCAPSELRK